MNRATGTSDLQLEVACGGATGQERCVAIRQWIGIERAYSGETGHYDLMCANRGCRLGGCSQDVRLRRGCRLGGKGTAYARQREHRRQVCKIVVQPCQESRLG